MKRLLKYPDIYFCTFFLSHPKQYRQETRTQNIREFLSRYLDVHVTSPVPVYSFLGAPAFHLLQEQMEARAPRELVVHLRNKHLEVLVIVLQDYYNSILERNRLRSKASYDDPPTPTS